MARESFDKEVQFLRMLALAGGAYSRQQFADRLGISVHTYDKTLRYIKDMRTTLASDASGDLAEGLRYNHYESADPVLLFLFRSKSLKDSESVRLAVLIGLMQGEALTAKQLLDACSDSMPDEYACPDEKTVRGDLKYLEEVGVIRRLDGGRPYRYRADIDLIDRLADEELLDLYDFVDVMANTQVPAVQGYLLRDTLKKALARRGFGPDVFDVHLYKYHYHTRILDEAHLYTVFEAIRERRRLTFLYLSPKKGKNYASKNTNPLFERETDGRVETTLPLRVIYDHQYGRWYLIGHSARLGTMKYRMEGVTQIELGDAVDAEAFNRRLEAIAQELAHSWVTDTHRRVKIRARFYNPGRAGANFVRERVEAQGQWGVVADESDATFLYEIEVNGIYEIKPWLRSFGSSCEVLEPVWLRRELIAEWKEIQAYYEPVREDL